MTRKNIKIDPDVYDRLKEVKEPHETWNHLLNRLAADIDPDA